MLISKLNEEHKDMLESLEQQFTDQLQKATDSERRLKEALDEVTKRRDELEKEKIEEQFMRRKIEEEYNKKVETHEEEVQLRLKFE
jgi:hypothetical protein